MSEIKKQLPVGSDALVLPLWEGKLWHDRGPYSDWGWIRDEAGNLIFIARSQCGDYSDEAAEHRRNKTDPTQPRVDALLAALNMDYPTGPHPIAGVNCDMMGNPILGQNTPAHPPP
jgi:hypothetical protein